jgi:1,4-alpha-glucan branching enzyme
MDVVFVLHSHLPYVLHHGRWPHGSDWLCEAALDSYLPLLEVLLRLRDQDIDTPITLGFTPVLANQLGDPAFPAALESYFDQRESACAEAPASLAATGDQDLVPIAAFWRKRYARLRSLFRSIGGDLNHAFALLEAQGRIELAGSAATHGFLPLLGRDESIDLQLGLGRSEHQRLFGRSPAGCWVPECAYRPAGQWTPHSMVHATRRTGIEEHVERAGFQYFLIDAHLAGAGQAADVYGNLETGREVSPAAIPAQVEHSPYRAYHVGPSTALLRDPISSRQVWSRYEGYPGDEHYLEFHKIRWPGGLKLWRVSAPGSDLDEKQPYRPEAARSRAAHHARHFASLLGETARSSADFDGAIVAPFDTELFGHWWFEGPQFLSNVFQIIARHGKVRGTTATAYLDLQPASEEIRLTAGSWGAGGDFRMWLNPTTEWTWLRLWALEDKFWQAAPAALADPSRHHVLAQAAREMLLAQASDWQFIISTGAAADYAEKRFTEHCQAADNLAGNLVAGSNLNAANRFAEELGTRNRAFPEILPAVAAVLGRKP